MAVGARIASLVLAAHAPLAAATLEIDARLLQATPMPELKQIAPYPRALCTYLYEVENVHAGKYDSGKILVVKWAVWRRKKLEGLPAKAGEVERLKLDRWIDYPNFDRERIVDAIREVDRVIYYDVSSKPDGVAELQAALEGREKELETGVVRGEAKGWLFLAEELRHAETGRFWEKDWRKVARAEVDPLPAMLDFQRRLKALGVELWIVPVPTKVSLRPRSLKHGLQLESQAGYLTVLRGAGLQIIDLEAALRLEQQKRRPWIPELRQDSHWGPRTCLIGARMIADRIRSLASGDRDSFPLGAPIDITIRGDLSRLVPGWKLPAETVSAAKVHRRGARDPGVGLSHPDSPFVLLGDSHVTVFSEGTEEMHGAGAGLPDYLANRLGLAFDVIASHGDGIHQARVNLYQQRSTNLKYPEYWKNKKAVIWVFSARAFTRAERWSTRVPVVRVIRKNR